MSGAAAQLISRSWTLSPNQVKYRLMATATSLPTIAPAAQGAGLLNLHGATSTNTSGQANQGVVMAVGGGSLQATRAGGALVNPDGSTMTDDQAVLDAIRLSSAERRPVDVGAAL